MNMNKDVDVAEEETDRRGGRQRGERGNQQSNTLSMEGGREEGGREGGREGGGEGARRFDGLEETDRQLRRSTGSLTVRPCCPGNGTADQSFAERRVQFSQSSLSSPGDN